MKLWQKIGFVVLVALQLAVLGFMIWRQQLLLQKGTPVMLACAPVDPRSLFSGDYVILNYKISNFHGWAKTWDWGQLNPRQENFRRYDTIYVALAPETTSKFWRPVEVAHDRKTLEGKGPVIIRGRVMHAMHAGPITVRYGVEEYFVPQFEGRTIEDAMRRRSNGEAAVSAEVVVAASGESALRRLFIEDQEVQFK